jgi:hypothetical protein
MRSLSMMGSVATGIAGLAAYVLAVRPRHLRWGATNAEVQESLPGDEVVPEPELCATHAVTVHAPIAAVWRWLIQVGQGRGGFYSYTWLENLAGCHMQNAYRVIPEFQNLRPGDVVCLHPKAPPVPVLIVEPGRALVLGGPVDELEGSASLTTGTWGFFLKEMDPRTTRLVMRLQWRRKPGLLSWVYSYVLLEPAHFIMERKMLLGIKARAEAEAGYQGKPT